MAEPLCCIRKCQRAARPGEDQLQSDERHDIRLGERNHNLPRRSPRTRQPHHDWHDIRVRQLQAAVRRTDSAANREAGGPAHSRTAPGAPRRYCAHPTRAGARPGPVVYATDPRRDRTAPNDSGASHSFGSAVFTCPAAHRERARSVVRRSGRCIFVIDIAAAHRRRISTSAHHIFHLRAAVLLHSS